MRPSFDQPFGAIDVEDLIIEMGAAIGHGFANLELPWQRDGDLRFMSQPLLRPHSWFRLHPDDQNTLTLRDGSATGAELWSLGWVQHRHKARPGYIARSGLHRMLAWPYLFQNYAIGDLAQLLEIYGIPARVGYFPRNATAKEKATLLRAVVSLGNNAAGIIPDGMRIDFLSAADGKGDLFSTMIEWCERSKARAILGGTLTSGTGEGTNTNALGNVHERSQHSIIRSDVRQYAGTIRRHMLWPLAALNFGIEKIQRAPRLYLETRDVVDLKAFSESVPTLLDIGMEISVDWSHEKTGIPRAGKNEDRLKPRSQGLAMLKANTATAALRASTVRDASDLQLERLQRDGDAAIESWIDRIREEVMAAKNLEDLQQRLLALMPELPADEFAQVMSDALSAAHLAGRYDILEGF